MIRIVTGSIDSGKTTKLLALYRDLGTGDGFILPKVYVEGNYAGQEILQLSTGAKKPFSFKCGFIPAHWNEKDRYDVYSFSREGFEFACAIFHDALRCRLFPVFLDEIGPLEMEGKGFHPLLSCMIMENIPGIIAVRESLLQAVIQRFHLHNPEVIRVTR